MHLTEQPLHQTLKQYRVLQVLSCAFIAYLMTDFWGWLKSEAATMTTDLAIVMVGYLTALLGAFTRAITVKEDA